MSSGGTLIERFVAQELDDSVRSILKDAFDGRMCSKSVLLREFEFNCFDVSLDFEKASSHCKMFFPLERVAFLIYRYVILSLLAV